MNAKFQAKVCSENLHLGKQEPMYRCVWLQNILSEKNHFSSVGWTYILYYVSPVETEALHYKIFIIN